jgi:hypothetical protein
LAGNLAKSSERAVLTVQLQCAAQGSATPLVFQTSLRITVIHEVNDAYIVVAHVTHVDFARSLCSYALSARRKFHVVHFFASTLSLQFDVWNGEKGESCVCGGIETSYEDRTNIEPFANQVSRQGLISFMLHTFTRKNTLTHAHMRTRSRSHKHHYVRLHIQVCFTMVRLLQRTTDALAPGKETMTLFTSWEDTCPTVQYGVAGAKHGLQFNGLDAAAAGYDVSPRPDDETFKELRPWRIDTETTTGSIGANK